MYQSYAALAAMACSISRFLQQQPEHCAGFAHASLHSVGFTHGFGRLLDSALDMNREKAVKPLQPVL